MVDTRRAWASGPGPASEVLNAAQEAPSETTERRSAARNNKAAAHVIGEPELLEFPKALELRRICERAEGAAHLKATQRL